MPSTDSTRARRELMWCLAGPRLLPDSGLDELELSQEAASGLSLAEWPELPSRLGRRFERIWAWALARLPDWSLLAESVQLRTETRTLGELDLLVRHRSEVLHLELAVKFYLCLRGHSGARPHHWVGPNQRDRLDLKLDRMRTHQLPLGQQAAARTTLTQLGLPPPSRSLAVLRGVRFSDWRSPQAGGLGRWCTIDELEAAVPAARVLHRIEWLGGYADDRLEGGDRLRAQVSALLEEGPVQLLDSSSRRVLVVPSDWPETAAVDQPPCERPPW